MTQLNHLMLHTFTQICPHCNDKLWYQSKPKAEIGVIVGMRVGSRVPRWYFVKEHIIR